MTDHITRLREALVQRRAPYMSDLQFNADLVALLAERDALAAEVEHERATRLEFAGLVNREHEKHAQAVAERDALAAVVEAARAQHVDVAHRGLYPACDVCRELRAYDRAASK